MLSISSEKPSATRPKTPWCLWSKSPKTFKTDRDAHHCDFRLLTTPLGFNTGGHRRTDWALRSGMRFYCHLCWCWDWWHGHWNFLSWQKWIKAAGHGTPGSFKQIKTMTIWEERQLKHKIFPQSLNHEKCSWCLNVSLYHNPGAKACQEHDFLFTFYVVLTSTSVKTVKKYRSRYVMDQQCMSVLLNF